MREGDDEGDVLFVCVVKGQEKAHRHEHRVHSKLYVAVIVVCLCRGERLKTCPQTRRLGGVNQRRMLERHSERSSPAEADPSPHPCRCSSPHPSVPIHKSSMHPRFLPHDLHLDTLCGAAGWEGFLLAQPSSTLGYIIEDV